MAAPDYVPTDPVQKVRGYSSPPARAGSWKADRAGDLGGGQPVGARLGSQGPDQGYALKLVRLFDDKLHLGGLDAEDVEAACVAIAMKRSAVFGRAPVVHDLTVAFTVWGFLDADPADELVNLREELFPQVRSAHHYAERRAIVDRVSDDTLHQSHGQIEMHYESDWRQNLSLEADEA